ncbi:HAMP domain-containing histidine kinase [Propioniciclava coleopterorum]|uniref:Sensor-like histidine kinase SenX3 n=1 Tax=Propioniciclava coleopterorum TaxID=2714937 RepID=A0A6G7Y4M0_9ACTN|nr:HAMP domain-containing sensor histidine kinase [Propioniciclava coleopterorum]QIK71733.1 HAMP domain-containing histidine kinase [Propioniciclava coleopterorum]
MPGPARFAVVAGLVGGAVTLLTWWLTPGITVNVAANPALVTALLTMLVIVVGVVPGWWRRVGRRHDAALAGQRAELTARAEAREAAARSSVEQRLTAERARLLGRIDHELKNPVMATDLALGRLRAAQAGSAEASEALETIATQSGRFAALLQSLRKITDVEHRELDLESVDLAGLLRLVHDEAQGTAAGASRHWTLALPQAPWPLPHVTADHDLLYLAVHNLVDNAVKYTRPGDRIEIRAAESSGGVSVEVADTGSGIPDAEVAGVWDELSRASTARGVAGQGLGLALVRSVVQRHGGRVALRSRVGTGTSAGFWLPQSAPATRDAAPTTTPSTPAPADAGPRPQEKPA